MIPEASIIILFAAVINRLPSKDNVFLTVSDFHPSLIFVASLGA